MIQRIVSIAACVPLLVGMIGGTALAARDSMIVSSINEGVSSTAGDFNNDGSKGDSSYSSKYTYMSTHSENGTSTGSTNNTGTNTTTTNNNNTTTTTPNTSNTSTNNSASTGIYAAMGDSVAAGVGLSPVSNPTGDDTRCGRSSQGYPNIVAQQTGLRLINASCSGATVGDIVTKQGVSGPNVTRQIDTAFSAGKPELITITAGANDVKWVNFLRACYAGDCATDTTAALATGLIAAMKLKLAYAMEAIQNRSNGSPPAVVVTGYYNPISNYCKGRQNFASVQEVEFLNKQRDAVNKTIRDVVGQYSFASYASTNFTGHAICASEPWIQGINDPAPIHPTARGQQHIAESVLAAVPSDISSRSNTSAPETSTSDTTTGSNNSGNNTTTTTTGDDTNTTGTTRTPTTTNLYP